MKTVNRKRHKAITIRLTDAEYTDLMEKVHKAGISQQAYIINAIQGAVIPTYEEMMILKDLTRIFSNLTRQLRGLSTNVNQMAHSDHQSLIGVHQDKDHLHCHIVTNSVSYIDGHKLHQTKKDLEQQKIFTNKLCLEKGLSVAKKGKHFDGSIMEQGEIIAWNKDKYNFLINDSRKSFVADCAIAIMESLPLSCNKDDFILSMQERGWSVQWTDRRKHIVFQNENGDKVRDSNIEKTFSGMEVNKEALTNEFTRQNELRLTRLNAEKERAEAELRQYYSELESAAAGIHTAEAVRDNKKAGRGDPAVDLYDTDSFIRELDSKEKASGKDRDDRIAERQDREAEQRRLSLAGERALKAEQQRAAEERTRRKSRSFRHSFSR